MTRLGMQRSSTTEAAMAPSPLTGKMLPCRNSISDRGRDTALGAGRPVGRRLQTTDRSSIARWSRHRASGPLGRRGHSRPVRTRQSPRPSSADRTQALQTLDLEHVRARCGKPGVEDDKKLTASKAKLEILLNPSEPGKVVKLSFRSGY
jgi:hypothetical protein